MSADEILEIIEKFFDAIKTVFAELKKIFNAATGADTDAAEADAADE